MQLGPLIKRIRHMTGTEILLSTADDMRVYQFVDLACSMPTVVLSFISQ